MKTMKIKCLLASLFLLINATFVEAQQTLVRGDTIILDAPPPPHWLNADLIYRASDLIQLDPDFSVKPGEDGSVFLENDPRQVYFPPSDYDQGGSPDNNAGRRVGNLIGNLDITPSGAANYVIPMALPPGIDGMSPELSFVYNSQAGDGIMGMGWSIGGLSKISRTPYTYKISNYTQAVQFSNEDQLFYNGHFLLKGSDKKYYSEIHDFGLIEPSNDEDINDGFKVLKPNGLTYYYGTSQNSRYYLQTSGHPIEWHISSIRDPFGNYIQFSYINDKEKGSFYPDKITYGGNISLGTAHIYEIKFNYRSTDRTDTQRKYFAHVNDSFHSQITKLLTSISIHSIPEGNEKLMEYAINHEPEGLLPKQLLKSIYVSFWEIGDGKKAPNGFNPITFEWEPIEYTIESKQPYLPLPSDPDNKDLHLLLDYDNLPFQKQILAANFNGGYDGHRNNYTSDLVHLTTYQASGGHPTIHVFENISRRLENGSDYYSYVNNQPKRLELYGETVLFMGVADMDGDSKDEIIIVYRIGNSNLKLRKITVTNTLEVTELGSITLPSGYDVNNYSFFVSDFTGNGLPDFAYLYKGNNVESQVVMKLTMDVSEPFGVQVAGSAGDYSLLRKVLIGDFNGNKRSEIMTITADYSHIYSLSNDNSDIMRETLAFPLHEILPSSSSYDRNVMAGDFNNDGKTDILIISGQNENYLNFVFSQGNGNFVLGVSDYEDHNDRLHIKHGQKFALDLNGDGSSDLSQILRIPVLEDDGDYYEYYYRRDFLIQVKNNGTNFEFTVEPFAMLNGQNDTIPFDKVKMFTGLPHWMWTHHIAGNFTGSSNSQLLTGRIVFKHEGGTPIHRLRTILTGNLANPPILAINEITDGFGKKSKIAYAPLTYQKPFTGFNKGPEDDNQKSTFEFPIAKYRNATTVVESISNETTEGQFLSNRYLYRMGRYHKLGKGFMGFKEIYTWNNGNQTQIKETFEVKTPMYHVVMSEKVVSKLEPSPTAPKPFRKHEYDYSFISSNIDTEKTIYFPYLKNEKVYYYEKENTTFNLERITETTNYPLDNYGNPQTIVQQYKNLQQQVKGSITNNILYENITTGDRRIIGLPKTIETLHQLADGPAIVRNVENDYNLTTGFLETRIHEPGSLKQLTESFVPDNFGNLQSHTQSAAGLPDRTTTTHYTPDGRFPHIITNAEGHSQVHEYYPVSGLLKSVTDENKLTTQYIYNPYRQLLYTIHPDGAQQGNKYGWVRSFGVPDPPPGTPEHGDPIYFIRSRRAGSSENIVFYDQHSRPVREIKQGFDNQWIFTDYTYYAQPGLNSLLKQKSNPFFASAGEAQNWITYNYDYRQRLIKTTMPDNSFESITYKANQKDANLFDGTTKSINYHETGLMHKVTDNDAAEVEFIYYPDGKLKESKVAEDAGTVIAYTYDVHGRPQTVDDPSLGLIEYDYDAFGDLRTETDSRSTTTYEYDRVGRLTDRIGDDGTTTWLWDTQQNGVGKLHSIAYAPIDSPVRQVEEVFTYNETGFVETHTQTIDNEPKIFQYSYDALSRLKQITWPTGFQTINYYDATGFLRHISNAQANKLWQAVGHDKWEKISQFKLGGALAVQYDFDGLNANVRSIRTKNDQGLLQRLSYIWDNATGNLESRTDHVRNLTESFDYDGFNRLSHITFGGNTNEWASYNTLGNITQKLDAGQYTAYKPTNPYAVETIMPAQSAFPPDEQIVDYTFFNKVSTILEGDHTLQIGYGPARERVWQQQANLQSGSLQTKRYFTKLYETVNDAAGQEKHLHYLIAPTGVFAIFTAMNDGSSHIQYLLKDHQGSLAEVAGSDGHITESYSFDAFGRRRNAQTWTMDNLPSSFGIDRGYTFHEHLDAFELINMNGRMYDPLVARFLSPDPFIQDPEYSQSYNRYSYVFNNPLRFVDPSGYFARSDSMAISNTMPVIFPQKKAKPIPYKDDVYETNTDVAQGEIFVLRYEGGDVAVGEEGGIGSLTSFALAAIVADASVLDPSDAAWQKWAGYGVVLAGVATYDATQRVNITYTLTNGNSTYIGRASGYGTPYQIMMRRYSGHHMRMLGYSNPILDRAVQGVHGYPAIRGREQQMIDFYGGVGSPTVGNRIRGVSKYSVLEGRIYHKMSDLYFGPLYPYTGF